MTSLNELHVRAAPGAPAAIRALRSWSYPAASLLNSIRHNKWISKTSGRGKEERTLGLKLVLHVFTQMMSPARW